MVHEDVGGVQRYSRDGIQGSFLVRSLCALEGGVCFESLFEPSWKEGYFLQMMWQPTRAEMLQQRAQR